MSKIKAIIFDYDGVIAESVNVKTEAFAELYKLYGKEIVKKVVQHHLTNGGMSRFEKFKIYHNEFLGQKISKEKANELSIHFSDLVLQKVIESPYVSGAFEFISSNYQKYDFHITTGTPIKEIMIILKRKAIKKYFKEIYGSPTKKKMHVKNILDKYNYKKEEIVLVGDSPTDRDAAKKNGVKFIGRYTTSEEIKKEKYLICDFEELKDIIDNI